MESLDLDAADVQRIDEILSLETGRGLTEETAQWRRRRRWLWGAAWLGVLVLGTVAYLLYRALA